MLGVKKSPTSGVLGERMSPVTGDDLTLNFWIMVLCAAGLIAMSFVYSDDDDEEESAPGISRGRDLMSGTNPRNTDRSTGYR